VVCKAKEGVEFYRPRQPQETPFYRLVERFYPEFERVYAERYQERYGFWRPIIARAVERFLDCGDLKKGFARVRCPKCRHELFVAFSCRGRCVCPSCHQKRALEKAVWVAEEVCAQVAHRQFVFTIPKRLRIYFRYDRSLLGELCQAACRTLCAVYKAVSGRADGVPGVIGAIQTFGDLVHWHPHIHVLSSEGVFLPDGSLVALPNVATEPFLKLWEHEVFKLLLAQGKITEEVVQNIRSWKHSGFSVDQSVRLEAGDREGIQRLMQYFLRCPFSQARMIQVTGEGKVIYKTGDNRLGRFPEAASDDLMAGPKRNFQIFDPLDFLAEVTQHIPEKGDHQIRYYGWYSNKNRGQRAKPRSGVVVAEPQESGAKPLAPGGKQGRKRWAALIKQVYEVDPLICPKCGAEMKIIAFIEARQRAVVEKILRHCGLWKEESDRGPPQAQGRAAG
jgi:ssDNA-binding Zn-finger/Zn-ribbon topoisomerase 1